MTQYNTSNAKLSDLQLENFENFVECCWWC